MRGVFFENGQRVVRDLAPEEVPNAAEALAAWRESAVCDSFQIKAALDDQSLLAAASAAVGAADTRTQLAWAGATRWHRTGPTMTVLAAALSLSDAQVDDLFRAAMAITA